MGWGDEIVAAGQAERIYREDPTRRVAICDRFGKPRWHPIWDGNPILAKPEDVARGEDVHKLISGPDCRPYIVYPFTPESGWTFNRAFRVRDHIAKLYLTPAELKRGEDALAKYGPYILIEPYSKHQNLLWPFDRWTELVASCPDITFVQHTHSETKAVVKGAHPEPATFREACGLVNSCRLYLRTESGMNHAAAALGKPTLTIWGGCMDWEVLGRYPLQTGIVDDGPGSPCGRWLPCRHCTAAMARITVEDVACALHEALQEMAVCHA